MIYGIDISSYQQGIDLRRARSEGIEFVIAKVTEGCTYRSPAWPAQRDQARAAGVLLAGYHYVRVGDPAGQAAACRAWLGDPSIPVMLDWENNGGDWSNFRAVLAAFRAAGLRVVLGYIPGWYHAAQGRPDLRGIGLAVVASRYPTRTVASPDVVYRAVPADAWAGYGGVVPTILQFSDRALVAGLQVDANAYLGTRAQLASLLGTDNTTPPGTAHTSTGDDDVAWTQRDGAPAVPDLYPGVAPGSTLIDPLWALANATAHAANSRDRATEARDAVAALREEMREELRQLASVVSRPAAPAVELNYAALAKALIAEIKGA